MKNVRYVEVAHKYYFRWPHFWNNDADLHCPVTYALVGVSDRITQDVSSKNISIIVNKRLIGTTAFAMYDCLVTVDILHSNNIDRNSLSALSVLLRLNLVFKNSYNQLELRCVSKVVTVN